MQPYVSNANGGTSLRILRQYEILWCEPYFFFLISVGAPLKVNKVENPSKEEVDNLHSLYVTALRELFDKHKKNYGIAEDEHLEII